MKQFPQETELDLEVHHTSDSRLYAIYHGARRLRYLCVPHTPYEKRVMCCRTIGINYPLTTPPDGTCLSLVLPAHRCDWSAYTPTQWFSQTRMSLKEAPMIRPMPVDQHGDHDNRDPPRPPGPPDHDMQQAPHDPPDPQMCHATGSPCCTSARFRSAWHTPRPVTQPAQQPTQSTLQPIS